MSRFWLRPARVCRQLGRCRSPRPTHGRRPAAQRSGSTRQNKSQCNRAGHRDKARSHLAIVERILRGRVRCKSPARLDLFNRMSRCEKMRGCESWCRPATRASLLFQPCNYGVGAAQGHCDRSQGGIASIRNCKYRVTGNIDVIATP
jgi:hypothetical protein